MRSGHAGNFSLCSTAECHIADQGLSGGDLVALGFEFGDVPRPLCHGHAHVLAQQGWITSHSFCVT